MSETLEHVAEQSAGDDLDSIISQAWEQHSEPEGPTRDERGRFASSRQEEPVEDIAEEHTDQPETKADEPAEAPAIDPPQSWSAEKKALWDGLSRDVQEEVLRRERDMDKVLSERATEQRELASFREVLAPYQSTHAMMGMTGTEAVRRLLAAEESLRRDPDRAFPELMRAYGYDPRRLGINPVPHQEQAPQQFQDPRVDRLLQEMEQRRQHETLAQIKAFADDPAHEHFEDVRADMGRLIAANPDMDLARAYKIAIAASDTVQAKIRAAAEKAAAEKARKEAAAKAEAAKRASVSVKDRSPAGSGAASSRGKSIDELLEEAWGG